ncbi:hypothetical protein Tco_0569760, partial [Tanacetum coccineum]
MLWEWRGIANMAFIQLGGNSRVDEMILARVSSGFAGEKYGATYKFTTRRTRESSSRRSLCKEERKDYGYNNTDVKARTTLLLALLDEHQLRFSKYDNAKELWEAILKTFGGNKATKKTKKNQLKQQYGNFKAEGSEIIE